MNTAPPRHRFFFVVVFFINWGGEEGDGVEDAKEEGEWGVSLLFGLALCVWAVGASFVFFIYNNFIFFIFSSLSLYLVLEICVIVSRKNVVLDTSRNPSSSLIFKIVSCCDDVCCCVCVVRVKNTKGILGF